MRNTKELERLLSKEFEELDFGKLRCSRKGDMAEKKLDKLIRGLSEEQIKMLKEYIYAHTDYEIEYAHEYGEFIINFYKSLLK